MDEILSYDFSQDGFLEGSTHMFLIEGTWSYHHDELDFRSCEEELYLKNS
ncbi:MAG TPA: hypothetical protein VMR37_01665 [Rhabdochlamydiaceae bacterium]|nr:hypothetical protein [Rhabdochlamydiaceae bacterium]